jgi:hypothetical protein
VPCSIAPVCLARWLNPIMNASVYKIAHGLLSHTVSSLEYKVLLPQACGLLDIMNSNLPPSSNWLCDIMGPGISSPLMVSEFTNGFDGAPSEMIFRLVALDNGNCISTSSKNGLKVQRLAVQSERYYTLTTRPRTTPTQGLQGKIPMH